MKTQTKTIRGRYGTMVLASAVALALPWTVASAGDSLEGQHMYSEAGVSGALAAIDHDPVYDAWVAQFGGAAGDMGGELRPVLFENLGGELGGGDAIVISENDQQYQ